VIKPQSTSETLRELRGVFYCHHDYALSHLRFAFEYSLATMLTQKDEQGNECPIAFMSTGLQGAKLNYPTMDKQPFVVRKTIKKFRPYILKNHTKIIVRLERARRTSRKLDDDLTGI
jgi:hypothetical protein